MLYIFMYFNILLLTMALNLYNAATSITNMWKQMLSFSTSVYLP